MNVADLAVPARSMGQPTVATPPSHRCLVLIRGALVTTGCLPIPHRIRTVRPDAPGQVSSSHHEGSPQHGSAWACARRWRTVLLPDGLPTSPWGWPAIIQSHKVPAPTASARHVIAMACARSSARQRIDGGIHGSSGRCSSRFRARSDRGHFWRWWPCIGAPPGRRRIGHAMQHLRIGSGCGWRASHTGVQRASAAVWGIPGTALGRPHGGAANTAAPHVGQQGEACGRPRARITP